MEPDVSRLLLLLISQMIFHFQHYSDFPLDFVFDDHSCVRFETTLNDAFQALYDNYYYNSAAAVDCDDFCFSQRLRFEAGKNMNSKSDAMLARENGVFSVFEASINIDKKCDMCSRLLGSMLSLSKQVGMYVLFVSRRPPLEKSNPNIFFLLLKLCNAIAMLSAD